SGSGGGPGTGPGSTPGAGPGWEPDGPDGGGARIALPGLQPPTIVDPLDKGTRFGGGGWLPEDPTSPFAPKAVPGMVEEADDAGPDGEEIDRLAMQAIATDEDRKSTRLNSSHG